MPVGHKLAAFFFLSQAFGALADWKPSTSHQRKAQEGFCLLEGNVENCEELLATQQPIQGCECYNYCGTTLQGCCEFGQSCGASCSNLAPGEVLTTGCQFPPSNITVLPADLLSAVSGRPGYGILTSLAEGANLGTLIGLVDPPITLFAPSDEAFEALGTAALEYLASPDNQEVLLNVLAYHAVSGEILSNGFTDKGVLNTFSGVLNPLGNSTLDVTIVGGNVILNGGAKIVDPDVLSLGGPVHGIDKVLIPDSVTTIPVSSGVQGGFCLLEENMENCAELTANQNPIAGCDCYNYCGNEFAGCCASTDFSCSVACENLLPGEVLTTGCTLPDLGPTISPRPTEAPTAAPLVCPITRNPENCAALTANQEPIDGCECYSYCGNEFQGCCAIDDFSCVVSCDALLPGEVLTAGCILSEPEKTVSPMPVAPTEPPTEAPFTCPVSGNTENCDTLTVGQSPIEGCDCYNYCGNTYSGCCAKDDFDCTVSCSGLGPGEVLTAGCQISNDVAPVEPPPPTPAPVPSPVSCPAEQNTENCPLLTQNQEEIEGCDCYSYCGSTFAGCCASDEPTTCGVQCDNLLPGQVLTAGCRLEDSGPSGCIGFNLPCVENTDCCTGRCLFETCQRQPPPPTAKEKISDGRGGAAGEAKNANRALRRRNRTGASSIRGE